MTVAGATPTGGRARRGQAVTAGLDQDLPSDGWPSVVPRLHGDGGRQVGGRPGAGDDQASGIGTEVSGMIGGPFHRGERFRHGRR